MKDTIADGYDEIVCKILQIQVKWLQIQNTAEITNMKNLHFLTTIKKYFKTY